MKARVVFKKKTNKKHTFFKIVFLQHLCMAIKKAENTKTSNSLFLAQNHLWTTECMIGTRANTHDFSRQSLPLYLCLWRHSSRISMTCVTAIPTLQLRQSRPWEVSLSPEFSQLGDIQTTPFTATQHEQWRDNEVLPSIHSAGLISNRGGSAEHQCVRTN